MRTLRELSLVEKIVLTGFIVMVGLGLLAAEAYTYVVLQGADGKPGISIQDVVVHYYGNRSSSKLQTMLPSMMIMAHVPKGEQPKMTAVVNHWVAHGESKGYYEKNVQPLINASCLKCHSIGMPNIGTFDLLKQQAKVDTGMPYSAMLMNGMIHLSTLGVIFALAGWIFSRTQARQGIKIFFIAVPFVAFLLDFAGWFLTKSNPHFVWLVLIGGVFSCPVVLLGMAISLYQLWLLPRSVHANPEPSPR